MRFRALASTDDVPEFKSPEGEKFKLPPASTGGRPLSTAMVMKRVTPQPLICRQFPTFFSTARNYPTEGGYNLRAAPSSGALAPELYVETPAIGDMCGGAYHYDPGHQLTRIGVP